MDAAHSLVASSARGVNQACAQFFWHTLSAFLMACVFLKGIKNDLRRPHSPVLTNMSLLKKGTCFVDSKLRTGNPLGPGVSVDRLIFFYSR